MKTLIWTCHQRTILMMTACLPRQNLHLLQQMALSGAPVVSPAAVNLPLRFVRMAHCFLVYKHLEKLPCC